LPASKGAVERAVNRLGDCCGFVVRSFGIGYLALWPLACAAPVVGLCRSAPFLPFVCAVPRFFFGLPPALHLIGLACVVGLAVRVVSRSIARWRRQWSHRAVMLAARGDAPTQRARAERSLAALPRVKPRTHFGLRGAPPRM
jgi:hypothetical protein